MKLRRYQLVWWGWDPAGWIFGLFPGFPRSGPDKGRIYTSRLSVGPLEIRRWSDEAMRGVTRAEDDETDG